MKRIIIAVLILAAAEIIAAHYAGAQRQEVLGHIYQCNYVRDGRPLTTPICSKDDKNAQVAASIFLCDWPTIDVLGCSNSMRCVRTARQCKYAGWGDPRNWWE